MTRCLKSRDLPVVADVFTAALEQATISLRVPPYAAGLHPANPSAETRAARPAVGAHAVAIRAGNTGDGGDADSRARGCGNSPSDPSGQRQWPSPSAL